MLRRLLETRNFRERALLGAFLWALVLLWLVVLMGSISSRYSALKGARMELRSQEAVISRADQIHARLEQARSVIDPARTFSSIRLSSSVDAMARQAGLTADIGSPQKKESGIFNTSSIRVSVRGASLEQLVGFTQAVRSEAPYIAIRRFRMSADQRDPRNLNAEIEIESFEHNQSLSR